jgi:hypothetical protein
MSITMDFPKTHHVYMSTRRYYITFPTLKETWIDNTHHPTLLEQGIEK